MENQQMTEELTPEQLEARRDEMKYFYESSIPYLESQAKYEKLLTEVEEARYKRATMQLQYASMMAATQPPMDDEEIGSDFDIDKETLAQDKRKLKRG